MGKSIPSSGGSSSEIPHSEPLFVGKIETSSNPSVVSLSTHTTFLRRVDDAARTAISAVTSSARDLHTYMIQLLPPPPKISLPKTERLTLSSDLSERASQLHSYLHTFDGVLQQLYLQTHSGFSRSHMPLLGMELGTVSPDLNFENIYEHFHAFKESLSAEERARCANVSLQLDQARIQFLKSSWPAPSLIEERLKTLAPGESMIIPVGIWGYMDKNPVTEGTSGGHQVILDTKHESDGTITIKVFNTGMGLIHKHRAAGDTRYERLVPFLFGKRGVKWYPYVALRIDPKRLDHSFWSKLTGEAIAKRSFMDNLLEFYNKLGQVSGSASAPEGVMPWEEFYERRNALLTLCQKEKNPLKLQTAIRDILKDPKGRIWLLASLKKDSFVDLNHALRKRSEDLAPIFVEDPDFKEAVSYTLPIYWDQGSAANCVYKSLSVWMKQALTPPLYQRFKVFMMERELTELKAHISRGAGLATTPSGKTAIKVSNYMCGFQAFLTPEAFSEMLTFIEKEIAHSKTKLAP